MHQDYSQHVIPNLWRCIGVYMSIIYSLGIEDIIYTQTKDIHNILGKAWYWKKKETAFEIPPTTDMKTKYNIILRTILYKFGGFVSMPSSLKLISFFLIHVIGIELITIRWYHWSDGMIFLYFYFLLLVDSSFYLRITDQFEITKKWWYFFFFYPSESCLFFTSEWVLVKTTVANVRGEFYRTLHKKG